MATRAQAFLKSAKAVLKNSSTNPKWYLSKSFWDLIFHVLDIILDTINRLKREATSTPIQSFNEAISTESEHVTAEDTEAYILIKLRYLMAALAGMEYDDKPMAFTRVQSQIDLLQEMLAQLRGYNGEERPNH